MLKYYVSATDDVPSMLWRVDHSGVSPIVERFGVGRVWSDSSLPAHTLLNTQHYREVTVEQVQELFPLAFVP